MTTKITSDNISSLSNMGVTWNAVTVADGSTQLSASAGNGYFLDTNTGTIEVFLPTSPTRGDTIILVDYSGQFATNKAIINTGGKLIDSTSGGGSGNEFELTTNNTVAELVFVDNNKGWLVTENEAKSGVDTAAYTPKQFTAATGGTVATSGDFKIHTFTGDGCFVTSLVGTGNIHPGQPTAGPNVVEYLVVAGGGGGGDDNAGAGGAGGLRVSSGTTAGCYTASPLGACVSGIVLAANSCSTTYPITVGGGGAAGSPRGASGSNSSFSTITSAGGGGQGSPAPCNQGTAGGSGGGGYGRPGGTGGAGNTPPVSPPQGNNGGNGTHPSQGGGGGGGAGAAGSNAQDDNGGGGGVGLRVDITGSPVFYSGGGGGGSGSPSGATATGGNGGGGNGGGMCGAGQAATANTGGGGGGGGNQGGQGAAGGKGVVILRYKFQ